MCAESFNGRYQKINFSTSGNVGASTLFIAGVANKDVNK